MTRLSHTTEWVPRESRVVLWLAPGWGPRGLDVAFNADALAPLSDSPEHQEHVDMLRAFTQVMRARVREKVTLTLPKHKPRSPNRFRQRDLARALCVAKPGDRVDVDPVSGKISVTIAKPGAEPQAVTDLDQWLAKREKNARSTERH